MVRRHDAENKITMARKRRVSGEVAGMFQPCTFTCVGWLVATHVNCCPGGIFLDFCVWLIVWLVGTHVHCFPDVIDRICDLFLLLCLASLHHCRAVWKSCACKIKRSTKNSFVRFGC